MGKYWQKRREGGRCIKPKLNYTAVLEKERRYAKRKPYTLEEMLSCTLQIQKMSYPGIERAIKDLKIKSVKSSAAGAGNVDEREKCKKAVTPSSSKYERDHAWEPVKKPKKLGRPPLPSRHAGASSTYDYFNKLPKKPEGDTRPAYLKHDYAAAFGIKLPPNYLSNNPHERMKLSEEMAKMPRIPKKSAATYIPVRGADSIYESKIDPFSRVVMTMQRKVTAKASIHSTSKLSAAVRHVTSPGKRECSSAKSSTRTVSHLSASVPSAIERSLPTNASSNAKNENSDGFWMNPALSEDVLNEVLDDNFCPDVTGLQRMIDESEDGKPVFNRRDGAELVRTFRSRVSLLLDNEECFKNDILIINAEDEPLPFPPGL